MMAGFCDGSFRLETGTKRREDAAGLLLCNICIFAYQLAKCEAARGRGESVHDVVGTNILLHLLHAVGNLHLPALWLRF